LVELKYTRMSLKRNGYSERDTGVIELDQKIRNIEKLVTDARRGLSSTGDDFNGSTDFQKDVVTKVAQLEDSLIKDQYELKSVDENIGTIEKEVKEIPQKGIIKNSLKREIETFSMLHADMFKRMHLTTINSLQDRGNFIIAKDPGFPGAPINLPISKKLLFSIFIGVALAFSIILVRESLSPKIIERGDLENAGFGFAGRYNNSLASRAEILASIDCLPVNAPERTGTQVILCASPFTGVDIRYFEPLAKYLADRSKKTLMVAIGHTIIPEGYEKVNTSRFVHFFKYPGGNEDLVWVLEGDAFDSVKSVLDQQKDSYHTIFIFVQDALNSSVYSLTQKMADKLFLVGETGKHSLKEYLALTKGFSKRTEMYAALLQSYGPERLQPDYQDIQQKIIQRLFKKSFTGKEIPKAS
jgi:hypothetical protein